MTSCQLFIPNSERFEDRTDCHSVRDRLKNSEPSDLHHLILVCLSRNVRRSSDEHPSASPPPFRGLARLGTTGKDRTNTPELTLM